MNAYFALHPYDLATKDFWALFLAASYSVCLCTTSVYVGDRGFNLVQVSDSPTLCGKPSLCRSGWLAGKKALLSR